MSPARILRAMSNANTYARSYYIAKCALIQHHGYTAEDFTEMDAMTSEQAFNTIHPLVTKLQA